MHERANTRWLMKLFLWTHAPPYYINMLVNFQLKTRRGSDSYIEKPNDKGKIIGHAVFIFAGANPTHLLLKTFFESLSFDFRQL